MRENVEKVLAETVRPQLALHHGDVELMDIRDGTVYIRLLGRCSNCPGSHLTTENLIYEALAEAVPEVKQVVVEQSVSQALLDQARMILNRNHGNT